MSTALVPMQDLQTMAVAFAKSALFGTKTPEQCMALMLLAQAEGVHPAIAMRDFDVIQGRPAKKAEAMLRSFLAAGGIVEWHEMSDTKAEASFIHPQGTAGKPLRISWDLERAKKAGLSGKDMYSKYGRQMLANRTISEGCRRAYPAATSGMYEVGEVRQIAREEKNMGKVTVVDEDDEKLKELEQRTESAPPPASPSSADSPVIPTAGGAEAAPTVTRESRLKGLCTETATNYIDLLAKADVRHADEMSEDDYLSALTMLKKRKERITRETKAA